MSDAGRSVDLAPLLAAAGTALAGSDSLDAGLAGLLDAAAEALGADSGVILVADPDRAGLGVGARAGIDEATADALAVAAADPERACGRAMARRELILEGSAAYAPLVVRREGSHLVLGVLAVDRSTGASFDGDRVVLEAVAALAAAAIDRARLGSLAIERSEWFERIAHADPLTGLANARTFARVLELELARAGRQRGEVSVAVFDVDGLARMNSESGNDAGDDVLREVAAVIAESIRLVDTVARRRDDEFALVAPGAAGLTVARRILDGVAASPSLAGRGVSVSAGIARFPVDGTTAEELLDAALRALAGAKAGGPASIAEAIAG